MTAFEMSEKKIEVLDTIRYLNHETDYNNTETVLLTNSEVGKIVECLNVCVEALDMALKGKG